MGEKGARGEIEWSRGEEGCIGLNWKRGRATDGWSNDNSCLSPNVWLDILQCPLHFVFSFEN